jgi:hypothetical protein
MFVPTPMVRKNLAAVSTKIFENPTRTGFRLAGPRDNPTTGVLDDYRYCALRLARSHQRHNDRFPFGHRRIEESCKVRSRLSTNPQETENTTIAVAESVCRREFLRTVRRRTSDEARRNLDEFIQKSMKAPARGRYPNSALFRLPVLAQHRRLRPISSTA